VRTIVITFGAFCLVSLAGLFAAVLAVGLYLSSPRQAVIGDPPATLPAAETVSIPSASGTTVHGWLVPGRGSGGVVLLHGVWENRLRMVRRARVLHGEGFTVLLIDLQAHGESPGTRITFGGREALDAAAAVQYLRTRLPNQRVASIGVSLGGAATVLGPQPLDVDALVLESVYPDIDSALGNRLRAALGPIVGPLVTPILVPAFKVLLPPILGVSAEQLRPIDHIGRVRAPLLLASGTADDRTRLPEARALFQRAPEPKRFWGVQGAGHVDLEQYDRDEYWRMVLPFLTEHLRRDAKAIETGNVTGNASLHR
jgi:fermentation-respiration switch protein FrsA (DUF1100 family)